MEGRICKFMRYLGVPFNSKGYWYLKEALLMSFTDEAVLVFVTKSLYPDIAIKYGTTVSSVEKSIRIAIRKSWENRRTWEYVALKGLIGDINNHKPSNSQFITLCYEHLKCFCPEH